MSLLTHIATRPHIFLLNTAIIMCTFFLAVFVARRAFAVMMISILWLICGITNFAVIAFRASPFTARDIMLIGYGLRIADVYLSPMLIALIAATLAVIAIGTVVAFVKLPKIKSRPGFRRIIITWVPSFIVLIMIASSVSEAVVAEKNGVTETYEEYGFAYSFTSSFLSSGIDRPDDYSPESVDSIVRSLDGELTDAHRAAPVKTNIIFVQLESFIDPAIIEGLSLPENPVPVFSALKERYPSGYLTVPVVGGSTANVEFEVLTGISSRLFALGEFPFETVLAKRGCESVAVDLKELGYTADAIHNHNGTFYRRNIVYSNLGFDRFIPLEYMSNVEYNSIGWAKDNVLGDYITGCLELTEGPDFIFTVSVQGHGKYPAEFDSREVDLPEPLPFDDLPPGELEYYITQLGETDGFIGSLTESLGCLDENVVLVLYGDHLPALSLSEEQLTTDSLYKTEYVIWSNFPLEIEARDIYSYELSAYVFDLLDIDNGVITKFHQANDYSDDADDILMTLGYDMLYGDNYAHGGEDVFLPTELQMGLDPICIFDAYVDDGFSYVVGENFTEFSVVNVGGQRLNTEYLDGGLLRVEHSFDPGDVVSVSQCGPDRVVLSSTDDYIYGE